MDAHTYLSYKARVKEKQEAIDRAAWMLFAGLVIGGVFGVMIGCVLGAVIARLV